MTPSSVVAAVVVTVLLAILIWWRDERGHVERSTEALNPPAAARSMGAVVAVPAARAVAREAPAGTLLPATGSASSAPAPLLVGRPYQLPPMTSAMRVRRQRVLESARSRAPAPEPASDTGSERDTPAPMKDRTGELGPDVKALDEQLLPLAAQCFAQAKERGVRGRGMLALEVKLAGAEGVGRIIESVEPAEANAIHEPELIDCVRQSAFTVDLPPPSASGSSESLLTIPFDGAPDAGAPASR